MMESSWFRKGFDSKSVKTETKNNKPILFDVDAVFCPSESSVNAPSKRKQEVAKPTNLNAFDIISLSAGFDLSGLFKEENKTNREVRFTSKESASSIVSKLKDVAKCLKLRVMKKDGELLKLEGSKEGRKRLLAIDAEIFEVTLSFHLVELKKCNGDTLEYQKLLTDDIRPALKDIVWTWQGDQEQPLQVIPS